MNQLILAINYCRTHSSLLFFGIALPAVAVDLITAFYVMYLDLDLEKLLSINNIELLQETALPSAIVLFLFILIKTVFTGVLVLGYQAIDAGDSINIMKLYQIALSRFSTLLGISLLQSFIFSFGFILFALPGFYFMGRLGMATSYAMLGGQKTIEALESSWTFSDIYGVRLFLLSIIFYGTYLMIRFNVGGLITIFVEYLTIIPLTYLFYSLYKSLNPASN